MLHFLVLSSKGHVSAQKQILAFVIATLRVFILFCMCKWEGWVKKSKLPSLVSMCAKLRIGFRFPGMQLAKCHISDIWPFLSFLCQHQKIIIIENIVLIKTICYAFAIMSLCNDTHDSGGKLNEK